MSRIGKLPIPLDSKVKYAQSGNDVTVEGPKGKLQHTLPPGITVESSDGVLRVSRANDSKPQRALHGLIRALLANAVEGVTKGFERKLEIHGVGYSAEVKGKTVLFKLGYSHPINFPIPDGVNVKVERTNITLNGHDRQLVGQVAANMRKLRKPDVYKQKGVRYADEVLRKKAGKAGAK
jgi:large subunit ribosomal protein L6